MKKHLLFLMILVTWFLIPYQCKVQASDSDNKHILVLNSYHSGFKWTDEQTEGIKSAVLKNNPDYNISIEHMDWKRYPTNKNLDNVYKSLEDKYASQKIDVIIATDDAAFYFALQNRSTIFSDAPVVFCGVNSTGLLQAKDESNYTGVLEEIYPEDTIRAALKINPSIDTIYLIYDNTESGISTGELCQKAANKVDSTLNVVSLNQKSSNDIINQLSAINQNSMILITTYFTDLDGTSMNHQAFCQKLSNVAPVPVYHLYDFGMNQGVFGGYLTTGIQQGGKAGELANRILEGEKADQISILDMKSGQFTYDYLIAQKYEIKEARISLQSTIINKPFSFIETYRNLVIVVLIIMILLVSFFGSTFILY